MGLLELLLFVLATYRLTNLFVKDSGPFDIFVRWRKFLGKKTAGQNFLWVALAEMFHCPYCLGVWMAIVVYFSPLLLVAILAVAGGQEILETHINKHER